MVVGRELKLATTSDSFEEKLKWLDRVVAATNNRVEEYNKRIKAGKGGKEPRLSDEEAIRAELSRWELGMHG